MVRIRDLASGPGRLTRALGIEGAHNGVDLTAAGSAVAILDDGTPPPAVPAASSRIGISRAVDTPWRWYVAGDPNVSGRPR